MRASFSTVPPEFGHAHGEFGAENAGERERPTGGAEPHHPAHLVVIGQGEGRISQRGGPFRERLRQGGPVEQGQGGVAMEFGVSGCSHENRIYTEDEGRKSTGRPVPTARAPDGAV